jgi:hypothetical protein
MVRHFYRGERSPFERRRRAPMGQAPPAAGEADDSMTRFHEAAHACAAKAYGLPIYVVMTGGPPGQEYLAGFCRTGSGRDAWADSVTNVAGQAADQEFFGILPRNDSGDSANVGRNIAKLPGARDIADAIEQARAAAATLVHQNRAAIERLADALLTRPRYQARKPRKSWATSSPARRARPS